MKEEKLNKQIDRLEENLDGISDKLQQLLPKKVYVDLEPFIHSDQLKNI